MRILIDGYNVIFGAGFHGKTRSSRALELARDRLLMWLSDHLPDQDLAAVTVVFDARKLPIRETEIRSIQRGVEVVFAVGYPDADTLIEELIAGHSAPKQLTVVSSDHRIQTAARRRRAHPTDSEDWLDQWESRASRLADQPPGKPAGKPEPPAELHDVDWVEAFGDVDVPNDLGAGKGDPEAADEPQLDDSVDEWVRRFGQPRKETD